METPTINPKEEENQRITQSSENVALSKRRKIGFFLIAIGAFLCVFGFLITMLMISQGVNFNVALYSTTGLGGVSLLGGLVAVMA